MRAVRRCATRARAAIFDNSETDATIACSEAPGQNYHEARDGERCVEEEEPEAASCFTDSEISNLGGYASNERGLWYEQTVGRRAAAGRGLTGSQ